MLFIIPVGFTTYLFDAFDLPKMAILHFFLCLTLPFAFYIHFRREEKRNLLNALSTAILSYTLIVIISYFVSINPYASRNKIFEYLVYVMTYFVWITTLKTDDDIFYIKGICVSGFIVALYALLQHAGIDFSGGAWTTQCNVKMRSISTIGNPGSLAGYLVIIMPMYIYLFLEKIRLVEKRIVFIKQDAAHSVSNIIYIISWCTCIAAVLLTYTRGAWIAIFMSHIVICILEWKYFWSNYRKELIIIFFAFITALSIAIIYDCLKDKKYEWFTLKNRIASVSNYNELYSSRFFLWKTSLDILKDHPFLGTGYGTFSYAYLKYRKFEPLERRFSNEYMGSCHNEFLEIASSTGLLGLLTFLSIVFITLFSLLKLINKPQNKTKTKWICIFACCIGYLLHIFFLFPKISNEIVWWFLLSLVTIEFTQPLQKHNTNKQIEKFKKKFRFDNTLSKGQIAVIIVSIVFSILIFIFTVKSVNGSYYLKIAKEYEMKKEWKSSKQFYDKAIEYDSGDPAYYLYEARMLEQAFREQFNKNNLTEIIISLYQKAIKIDPADPYAWANMGRFYQVMAETIDKNNAIEAEKAYHKAIELDPYNYLNYNYLATLYTFLEQYDLSLDCFLKSINLYPKSYLVHYNLGVMYYMKKDMGSAKAYFQKALEFNPNYYKAKNALDALNQAK